MNNSPKRIIKVGSRDSKLASKQVRETQTLLKRKRINVAFDVRLYRTSGDKDKKTPLTENLPDDFFTDNLDKAILNKKIDIAVHSAKDLPQSLKSGLCIFAITASIDRTDAFVGKSQFIRLKKGAKVGTSSLLRQQNLKAQNSSLKVYSIRGDIEERLEKLDQGRYDGIIVATAALKRLGLRKRIKNIMPWETTPLQGQLAIVGRQTNRELKKVFEAIDVRRSFGKVTLVGAGPGDPELITFKGVKALREADVVFYDYLIDKRLLKHAPKAKKVYVGKRKGADTLSQEELSKQLRKKAMAGCNVVRLKGGDPFIFGRGADEISYLNSYHIDVDIIPGISSATGIPSSLKIPLTARGLSSSVAFISGYGKNERNISSQRVDIPSVDTIVCLMGLTKLDIITKALLKKGWKRDTPIIVISKGTYRDEKIVHGTLRDIRSKVKCSQLKPPALIIAGPTVKFFKNND